MTAAQIALAVLAAAAAAAAAWVIATYNRLVLARNKVGEAWAGIDVQLQRRADLVPALVDTVKGYKIHEQSLLESVTQARAGIARARGPQEAGQADDQLEAALGGLFAVAEAYPDLKASANFLELQRQLTELEEEISFARRYYNALVQQLNTRLQSFPTLLVAGLLGFRPAEYFKADEADRAVPAAEFGG
ncbi:MAG TPA: LemA family protein [Egibacteraceae bacterium]|nr:LemA family protein [Egibacteraceae bacterium]